jgi:hypothetical protein
MMEFRESTSAACGSISRLTFAEEGEPHGTFS